MEHQTMFLKTIVFQKTAFANTLEIFSSMRHHGETLLKTTLEQSLWLPESSRKACLFWADVCTKNFENVKVLVDQGFTEMERFSSTNLKPGEDKPQKTEATGRQPAPRPAKKTATHRKKTINTKKVPNVKTASIEKAALQEKPAEKKAAIQEGLSTQQPAAVKTVISKPEHIITPQPAVRVEGDGETSRKVLSGENSLEYVSS